MTEALPATRIDARRWFYHWMALTCLVISFTGFTPTFFVPVAQGAFHKPPVVYLHGFFYFSWVVYFSVQTWFAASGRVLAHREWGLLGVALATAMAWSVLTVAGVELHANPPRPPFMVIADISAVLFFETCIVAALANVRRPETHKRFMLLATVNLLGAPFGRLWFTIFRPPAFFTDPTAPPPGPLDYALSLGPLLAPVLLLVAAMVFDWRTRRRVSLIYAVGLPAALLISPLMGAFAATPAGLAIVDGLRAMGG